MADAVLTQPVRSLEPAVAPTLADLGALMEQIDHAGLTTELRVDGRRRPQPPGLELSAYRIARRR